MKRALTIALAALAVAAIAGVVVLSSCSRTVSVQSGVRYVCTYGETVGSDVKTLQVPAADAKKYRVETVVITCDRHKRAERLYAEAQKALEKGDLKTAEKDLAATVKLDPKFREAPQQLADIKKGGKPKPDTASNPATTTPIVTPPPSGDASKPPASGGAGAGMDPWRDIVPDQLTGFRAETVSAEELTLVRDYVPSDTSRYDQLVIQVQRYSTPKEASRAVSSQIAPSYPGSPNRNATAMGLKGYFGVNGQKAAVLSLADGDVVVSLELHATGAAPAGLYKDLVRIAEEVLD